jgi:L-threonylcarbamoyladenylate synthase
LPIDPPSGPRLVPASALTVVARALVAGELVIVPTGRWYMLCCDATDPAACQRLVTAKRRPPGQPLLLVPELGAVEYRFVLGPYARRLAAAFWPGDLTLILPWRDPDDELAGESALGTGRTALVARPDDALGELAAAAGRPVAASSANVSGTLAADGAGPATTVAAALRFALDAGAPVAMVMDGGRCDRWGHLTVVNCTDPDAVPTVTRAGSLPAAAVRSVLAAQ